ncbi:unnamed protein product, partial [Discosporangium mesarthrocarpum]
MSEGEAHTPQTHEVAYVKVKPGVGGQGPRAGQKEKNSTGLSQLGLGAWPKSKKELDENQQVIHLKDIDIDGSTAADFLVRQHTTRVRVKRVKPIKDPKRRRRRPSTVRNRIRTGKLIHPQDDEAEYNLTIRMMLWLRVAVGRQENPQSKKELSIEDFYLVDKYVFPPSGATGLMVTPSHKLKDTFKFKDYAPKVFKKIREHFGVDKVRSIYIYFLCCAILYSRLLLYMQKTGGLHGMGTSKAPHSSMGVRIRVRVRVRGDYYSMTVRGKVTRKWELCAMSSPACMPESTVGLITSFAGQAQPLSAGQAPPLTPSIRDDHNEAVLGPTETKFLRRILPHYYEHMKTHPDTFLVKFYGMYRVKMQQLNKRVHFIVMNSVVYTHKEIHVTYDLKGSSLGRNANKGEKVFKDNDLPEKQGKLHLGKQRDAFLNAIRADSEFLARMKIMDYSLLTGIHNRNAVESVVEPLHGRDSPTGRSSK